MQTRKNYHQVKKQKELSRKARQQEKQQRRTARPNAAEPAPAVAAPAPVAKPASKKRSGRHAKSGASFEEPMRPRGGADDVIPPSE